LRFPYAIRPWQHVLDCLNGYMKLVDSMIKDGISGEWNFGPDLMDKHEVLDLVKIFAKSWGVQESDSAWTIEKAEQPHEAGYLLLDSSKARNTLGWSDKLNFQEAVDLTSTWYRNVGRTEVKRSTEIQVESYFNL
jgi:CDP-glucose 4,6-dehydratase